MKRKIIHSLTLVLFLAIVAACGKKGGDSGGCSEPAMSVTLSPAAGTVEPPGPGPNFPLTVTITSNLPSAGVTIEVKAHQEGSATNFFSQTKTATGTTTNFDITGTPATTSNVVEVTVTSKSCASNKFTASYKYSRK